MSSIVFDTGPMISMTLNNLIWVLDSLKAKFNGDFYITPKVKEELIDKPLQSKKFKLEALQSLPLFNRETLKVFTHTQLKQTTDEILELANNTFEAHGKYIQALHYADMEIIAAAYILNADAIVIDEYTCRYLIENPVKIAKRFQRKLHTEVTINQENLKKIKKYTKNLKVMRSVELVTIAYEMGLLDIYLFDGEKRFVDEPKKAILEGALWGLKLNGCGVHEDDIKKIINIENKRMKLSESDNTN